MNTEITINDDKNSTGRSYSKPGQKSLRNEEEWCDEMDNKMIEENFVKEERPGAVTG